MFHRGFFATVATVFATFGLSIAGVPMLPSQPPCAPIPRALVAERMDAEIDRARGQGFDALERHALEEPHATVSIQVEPRTCLAVVAGTWGSHHVRSVAVLPEGTPLTGETSLRTAALSADPGVRGLVASTQLCNGGEARELIVEVLSERLEPMQGTPGFGGELVLLRASFERIGGVDGLRRGYVLEQAQ